MPRWTRNAIALLLPVLSGCATTLHSIPPDRASLPAQQSVVFGRVSLDFGKHAIGFFDHVNTIHLTVRNLGTDERYEIVCDQGGSDSEFFVAIPPGDYRMEKQEKGNAGSEAHARFTVPPNQVVYLGTFRYVDAGLGASIGASLLSGGTTIAGKWRVQDDFQAASTAFQSGHPKLVASPVKALAVLEN
jgi:hypothetical protein